MLVHRLLRVRVSGSCTAERVFTGTEDSLDCRIDRDGDEENDLSLRACLVREKREPMTGNESGVAVQTAETRWTGRRAGNSAGEQAVDDRKRILSA